ncbi:MAG: tRNA preQ1(34) S-adenosylmethionine ribosyltransferase-isomerase QueA [Clostridia bacterium]|nr:tRNA preQ1(34) S-adenosylmethionine ribosyltransferase-isomerase QueA [Clostridia bacterium]
MKTSDFDYYLPEELIAQTPIEPRDHSRLLVYNRKTKVIEHKHFYDIINYLSPNDVLVVNNTRVIPARIYGKKKETGAKVELLLLKRLNLNEYECLIKPAKKFKVGTTIEFSSTLSAEIIGDVLEIGGRVVKFYPQNSTLEAELEKLGEMPLPPYIHKKLEDKERYQTVYSKIKGSSAAPTAGLHFTPELLKKIKEKGIEIIEVTLNVGLGTFRPVTIENIEEHHMHSEYIEISPETASKLNAAKKQGKRIIAVGTTSVRTLESASNENGEIRPIHEETNIFIYPGYKFKFVDSLITNFHLPKSTLLMLVSALSSREEMLDVYNTAVKEKYRFFSFGDSMFII